MVRNKRRLIDLERELFCQFRMKIEPSTFSIVTLSWSGHSGQNTLDRPCPRKHEKNTFQRAFETNKYPAASFFLSRSSISRRVLSPWWCWLLLSLAMLTSNETSNGTKLKTVQYTTRYESRDNTHIVSYIPNAQAFIFVRQFQTRSNARQTHHLNTARLTNYWKAATQFPAQPHTTTEQYHDRHMT